MGHHPPPPPLSLLALSYLLPYSADLRLPFIVTSCGGPSPTATTKATPTAEPEFRLLIGIHTVPAKYHRRHALRLAYFLQQQPTAAPRLASASASSSATSPKKKTSSSSPSRSCTTTTSSSSTALKARSGTDDDTYLRLDELVKSLKGKAKRDVYYGTGGEGKDFEAETIAVHQLKEDLRLVRTLKHFNVTTGLKASKLYHIP
uniref:Uncharacterized protein n=1 Tax=Ananas comosus var. bracteatus TaxID=296719 RepID=A0A6V7NSR1_ANACO|nr:unnamed protein product [Ananas comosus var. bracteatus]